MSAPPRKKSRWDDDPPSAPRASTGRRDAPTTRDRQPGPQRPPATAAVPGQGVALSTIAAATGVKTSDTMGGSMTKQGKRKRVPDASNDMAGQPEVWGKTEEGQAEGDNQGNSLAKQQVDFKPSGALAADDGGTHNGTQLKFTIPPDSCKPDKRWRLYVFKKGIEDPLETLHIHRSECYLFGRDRQIADVPTDHPSCSKQHAVLQYRKVLVSQIDGSKKPVIRPYVMDLGSTNGTKLNGEKVEERRYYELRPNDALGFGESTREYILIHDQQA